MNDGRPFSRMFSFFGFLALISWKIDGAWPTLLAIASLWLLYRSLEIPTRHKCERIIRAGPIHLPESETQCPKLATSKIDGHWLCQLHGG